MPYTPIPYEPNGPSTSASVAAMARAAAQQLKDSPSFSACPVHAYLQPSTETEPGTLLLVEEGQDEPEGYELLTPSNIRPSQSFSAIAQDLERNLRTARLIPYGA